jgi:ABC-type dipeptide/oligopeptide/nickel transport system permease subunit
VISWGALLGGAQHFVREAWWMSVFPGIAIMLTVLSCNLIAGALSVPRRSSTANPGATSPRPADPR